MHSSSIDCSLACNLASRSLALLTPLSIHSASNGNDCSSRSSNIRTTTSLDVGSRGRAKDDDASGEEDHDAKVIQ